MSLFGFLRALSLLVHTSFPHHPCSDRKREREREREREKDGWMKMEEEGSEMIEKNNSPIYFTVTPFENGLAPDENTRC